MSNEEQQVLIAIQDKWEEESRFRNGYIRQRLTSVDIEEIDRVGGVITELFEGFICDNLYYTPFEKIVLDMMAKRNKYKKEKKTYYKLKLRKYQMLFMVILYVTILKVFTNVCLLIGLKQNTMIELLNGFH